MPGLFRKSWASFRPVGINGHVIHLLIVLYLTKANCQQSSCGSAAAIGSGDGIAAICGDNSECINNAICQCETTYFTPSGNHTDCRSNREPDPRCSKFDSDCVFCGPSFNGPCQGCPQVLYDDQCLTKCPDNTLLEVLNLPNHNLVVRNCKGSASNPLPEWAVIIIVVMGVVALVIFAVLVTAVACAFLRRSSVGQLDIAERNAKSAASGNEQVDSDGSPGTLEEPKNEGGGVMEDYFEADTGNLTDEEIVDFFAKLSVLRTQAETFLKMLNDMRRRLKELPPNSPATQQYKDVMRDLTRLLYILNKKQEAVRIPPDGLALLDWSEQILNRYLTAQGKQTIDIRVTSTSASSAATNPNRISVIGDQTTTHF